MNLRSQTVRELAVGLKQDYFPQRHILPWNRHDVKGCDWWWLSSEQVNPVFQLGKIMIAHDPSWMRDDEVFIGFNVEKGLAEGGDWRDTEVMTDDWYWHQFLKEMTNDAFQDAYGKSTHFYALTGLPVEGQKWGDVLFKLEGLNLHLLSEKPGDSGPLIREFTECPDLGAFQTLLKNPSVDDFRWRWLMLACGQFFTIDPEGTDDSSRCLDMIQSFQRAITADNTA
jgi:hypothetical protein